MRRTIGEDVLGRDWPFSTFDDRARDVRSEGYRVGFVERSLSRRLLDEELS